MRRLERLSAIPATILLALALAGCATPDRAARPDLLTFLEPGRTHREDVLLKLGQPSAAFEQERIITYRIGETARHDQFIVTPGTVYRWQKVRYSLVLVFDGGGILRKQALVCVE